MKPIKKAKTESRRGPNLEQLVELGKERGYLTYKEVNDLLPHDIVSAEQIDNERTAA